MSSAKSEIKERDNSTNAEKKKQPKRKETASARYGEFGCFKSLQVAALL